MIRPLFTRRAAGVSWPWAPLGDPERKRRVKIHVGNINRNDNPRISLGEIVNVKQ
jgi:hypothetical protein